MEFKQARLDNGLTIIGENMPNAKTLALGFFVRTGSRDETPDVAGVSHFLEHMMFKGTIRRSAREVNLEFDRMGARYNAFTSEEMTVYFAAVLPEFQEQVLDIWADLMRPSLRRDDFDTEKGVICEEIAMYKDRPDFEVVDRCRSLHFDSHGCGNSVLGTVGSIKALPLDEMAAYFNRRYSPDNIVLAGVGPLDWDALVAQAADRCGRWPPSDASRDLTDFGGTGVRRSDVDEKVVRQHLCLMIQAPSAQSRLRYAARVLETIIGDGSGSRFHWSLVDAALADAARLGYDAMDGTGTYIGYVSCDPAQHERVLEIAGNVFMDIRKNGVSDAELTAAKNKIGSSVTLRGELSMGRLVPLGSGWLYRREYSPLADELERIRAVSQADMGALLDAYPMKTVTISGLGPPNGIKN